MNETAETPVIEKQTALPETGVAHAIETVYEGLEQHEPYVTAMWENIFRAMGIGRPREKLLDPLPFDIDGEHYEFSPSPHKRKGFAIDDTLSLVRGEDSLLFQVSHSEFDLSHVKEEAVVKFGGRSFSAEEALMKAREVFPRFYPTPQASIKTA